MSTPPFFNFWVQDFMDAVRRLGLTPAEAGALTVFMCNQWQNQDVVSLDPRKFALYSGWDIRVCKRLIDKLHDLTVIKADEAGQWSDRMTFEIEKYCQKVAEKERRKAEKSEKSATILEEFSDYSQRSSQHLSRKPNEIKDGTQNPALQLESESKLDKKEYTPLPPTGGARAERDRLKMEVAREAFDLFRVFTKRLGLPVPTEASFLSQGKKIGEQLYRHAEAPKGRDQMLYVYRCIEYNVEISKFLRGMEKPRNPGDRPFRADLAFILQNTKFERILTGFYGNGAAHISPPVPGQNHSAGFSRVVKTPNQMTDAERAERQRIGKNRDCGFFDEEMPVYYVDESTKS